jgi:hypothetical protein
MRHVLIVGMAVLITGCSQTMLVKDGMTPQQFEADKFDCEQKVVTMYGGYAQMGAGHAIMARQDMIRCMQVKGYRTVSMTEVEAAHKAEIDRIRAENAARAAAANKSASETPTLKETATQQPTTCVGKGCAPSLGY